MTILPPCHPEKPANFACAQAGRQNCLEYLIQENESLIHACLQQQEIGGVDCADLVQEGRIALCQAVLHFNPQRGVAFSSYAWVVIRHQVWRSVRYANQSHHWSEVEEARQSVSEIAEAACWGEQVRQELVAFLDVLPKRLRQVIMLSYGLAGEVPLSLAAIGRQWGLSRERIRQLRNDALVVLRLPADSAQLRSLCEQDSRQAYQRTQTLNRTWLGRRRRCVHLQQHFGCRQWSEQGHLYWRAFRLCLGDECGMD